MKFDWNTWRARIAEQPVVVRNDVSGIDFLRKVDAWQDYFSARPEATFALYVEECSLFGPVFMGLAAAGKSILLLPRKQEGFLLELKECADVFVLDEPVSSSLSSINIHDVELNETGPASAWAEAPEPQSFNPIYFYTSGSTGGGKKIEKTVEQLVCEVDTLEGLWGRSFEKATMLSTVSHQHIYGFLFSFFWPLLKGRALWPTRLLFPGELTEPMQQCGQTVLVSCPAHIKRMPTLADGQTLRTNCSMVFSSGGPLPLKAALGMAEVTGHSPVEVFGSTETGGIAWRQQQSLLAEASWTPFPVVEIDFTEEPSLLKVRSPFIHEKDAGEEGWFTTSDQAERSEECGVSDFNLLGRVDRIMKVEQKRISLDDVESWLAGHELVREAVVISLAKNELYDRDRLGTLLVLSEEGLTYILDKGRSPLVQRLREHLLTFVDHVVIPKKWRFTTEIPRNAQGKCEWRQITASIRDQSLKRPVLLAQKKREDHWELTGFVPDQLEFFQGHFDEISVVPGVVHIHWVAHYAEKLLGLSVAPTMLEAIKFQSLLFPGAAFRLILSYKPETKKVHFSFKNNQTHFSSGRILLKA